MPTHRYRVTLKYPDGSSHVTTINADSVEDARMAINEMMQRRLNDPTWGGGREKPTITDVTKDA